MFFLSFLQLLSQILQIAPVMRKIPMLKVKLMLQNPPVAQETVQTQTLMASQKESLSCWEISNLKEVINPQIGKQNEKKENRRKRKK